MRLNSIVTSFVHNKTMRNGALFASFSFLNKGFGFLLLLILATFITPAEYGYLSLYTTVLMVVGYFIALSSEGYMDVAYFQDKINGITNTFSCVFFLSISFLIVALSFVSLKIPWVNRFLGLDNDLLYICLFTSFFTIYNNLILSICRVKENVKAYGILSCGSAFLNFTLSIILVKYCSLSWYGRVYAQGFCALLFGTISLVYFFKNGFFSTNVKKYFKPLLMWSIPLIPHLATNFIRSGCDRYIINKFHSISDVGLFSFALTLANIIVMIGAGFNQSNSVDIYKVLGDENLSNKDKMRKQKVKIRNYVLMYVTATILVVISVVMIIPLLLPKYVDAMPYFCILCLYGLFVCFYLVYTNYLFFYNKTKNIMYVTVGSALLHLALSLAITRYSLYITAGIYVITQGLVVIAIRHLALKSLKEQLAH